MNSSKKLLLSTIAMIGSFSAIRTEFTPAEKIAVKQLAEKTFNAAIDRCDEYDAHQSLYKSQSTCNNNLNLFMSSIDQMPATEVTALIGNCVNKVGIAQRALKANRANCIRLIHDLQRVNSDCEKAIEAGNGSSTYFELTTPEAEQQELNKVTLAQLLKTDLFDFKTDLLDKEIVTHLQQLEKSGKGGLTIIQAWQLVQEGLVRKELDLMQNNK